MTALVAADRVYSIHVGGRIDGPEIPGFDSETCREIWEQFASAAAYGVGVDFRIQNTHWERAGLGRVEDGYGAYGYDRNVTVYLESDPTTAIDAWMWCDNPEWIENWRRFH